MEDTEASLSGWRGIREGGGGGNAGRREGEETRAPLDSGRAGAESISLLIEVTEEDRAREVL